MKGSSKGKVEQLGQRPAKTSRRRLGLESWGRPRNDGLLPCGRRSLSMDLILFFDGLLLFWDF
jgi:hypothetical protein